MSTLKIRFTKIRDWINIITLLYEKTLKQSMVDKKIDEKEANGIKRIFNHYLDKRSDIMKNTQFKVDIFADIIRKDNISQYQIIELIVF